jgi:hypothetical protein
MSESNQRRDSDVNFSSQDNPDDIDREYAEDDGRDQIRTPDQMNRRGMMIDTDIRHQAGTDLHDGSGYDQQRGARYDQRMGSGGDVQEGARSSGHRVEGSADDGLTANQPRNSGTGETDASAMHRRSNTRSATNVGDDGFINDSIAPAEGEGAIRVDPQGDYALADTEQTQTDHFREARNEHGTSGEHDAAPSTQAEHFQVERRAQSQEGGYLGMTNTSNMSNERTVAAVFHNWNDATRAVNKLRDAGFDDDSIGIARLDNDHNKVQQVNTSGEVKDDAENVAGGVATGAAVGGVAGLLAALASLAIPGVGPIVAGGMLATTFGTAAGTAIAGAGVGAGIGAATGGLIGALTSLGLSEDEARSYESDMRNGSTLVTVRADHGRADEVIRMLQQMGGETRSRMGGSSSDPNWRFG